MSKKIQKLSPLLQRVVAAACPSYRGRKWRIGAATEQMTASYWDGGRRSYFWLVQIGNGFSTRPCAGANLNPIGHTGPMPTTEIPRGWMLVEESHYDSKTSIYLYHHPDDTEQVMAGVELADSRTIRPGDADSG